MRFLSICSGIEAASVAWHPLGWRAIGFAEIEPFPSAVLAHHYPGIPNHGDITRYRDWPDADVDVLVGGTPCQSFSVAGLRKGLADPRGNLALTFLGIADRYRPEWLIWENVPGVLSQDKGRAFASILGGMAELGYHPSYRTLDAQYVRVDGFGRAVPQRRRRVFVVGNLGDWRRSAAVLFEPESLSGNLAPRRQAGKGVSPSLAARTKGGGGLGTDFDCDGGLIAFGGNDTSGPINVATVRNAHGGPSGRLDFESETFVAHALRADGFDAGEDGSGRGTPLVAVPDIAASLTRGAESAGKGGYAGRRQEDDVNLVAFDTTQITSKTNRCQPEPGDPCHSEAHAPLIAFQDRFRGDDGRGYDRSPPISHEVTGALETVKPWHVAQQWVVRRLTPRECERLQGFPDDYTLISYRGKSAADGPRYKALGNSMAVNVMRWLATRIQMVSALALEAAE